LAPIATGVPEGHKKDEKRDNRIRAEREKLAMRPEARRIAASAPTPLSALKPGVRPAAAERAVKSLGIPPYYLEWTPGIPSYELAWSQDLSDPNAVLEQMEEVCKYLGLTRDERNKALNVYLEDVHADGAIEAAHRVIDQTAGQLMISYGVPETKVRNWLEGESLASD
jgi:hypothetical protein